MLKGLAGWLRRHPRQADGIVALVLLVFSTDQGGLVLVVSLALAATVVVRQRYPVAAFWAAAAVGAIQFALRLPPVMTDLALLVLLYTLAASRPRRVSAAGLAASLLLTAGAIARWSGAYRGPLDAIIAGLIGLTITAWLLGDSVAVRRAYYAALEDRAVRLEAERDAQERIAAAAERARELQEHRARLVDESAARLRGIERDLHDGAQVRLTALAMALGEIKERLDLAEGGGVPGDDGRTGLLVAAAHRNAKEALAELRDLVRGIHPPVLDRGLEAAIAALGETSQIPVRLSGSLVCRPSPAIESMAYFCIAELLANAAKHSGATHVGVVLGSTNDMLVITVSDDGGGGAQFARGGGLAGLLARVSAVDGCLDLSSPPGGPTAVSVQLPGHA